MRICPCLDDRLALQEILDDVVSKFAPHHVNIFYCFGGLGLHALLVEVTIGGLRIAVTILTFYYRPAVSEALASVRSIRVELIRGGPSVGQATLL